MATFTQATTHNLTVKHWDKTLHEQVNDKQFFKNQIGDDKGGEGSIDSQVINKPIVRKTQLGKDSGDQITMGLVRSLVTGDLFNAGKTGNTALVDAETAIVFHNVKVKIGHYRNATVIEGKMTVQRSPYNLLSVARDVLSTHLAEVLDDGIFFAIYSGFSFNVLRELGTTEAAPTNHLNRIFGKDKAALADLDTTDVLDTDVLERLSVAVRENNINPIMVDGSPYFMLIAHPRGIRTLRADSAWVDANAFAQPRGMDNPVFAGSDGAWAGIFVKPSNKISTSKNYGGLTVASDAITLADDTGFVGITAADVRINILLGSNAVARAFALESYLVRRKEDKGNMFIEDFVGEGVCA